SGWPRVVATGLTSLLPMIPSSQPIGLLILLAGPNSMPAVCGGEPVMGDRYITRMFWPKFVGEPHIAGLIATSILVRYMLPPFKGSPSKAYHCRSTTAFGT